MSIKLHQFHGGLHLNDHKAESMQQGLQQASLPDKLYLPLKQHIGDTNKPLVDIGDRVLKGQLIAGSSSPINAPIHATTSGVISAIGPHTVPHPSGQADECIVIEVDGKDEAIPHQATLGENSTPSDLIHQLRKAGIVGLGGAVFPTSAKVSRGANLGIDTLIINGAECEPYITCDDTLMQTSAREVIRGIFYLQKILNPNQTIIGIENNKADAVEVMQSELKAQSLTETTLAVIPTIYPSGGEKQLIKILTGKEVPKGKLAFDIGLFCQNVGTCAAITRAIESAQPLISRIITVSGDGINQPGNWEVRLGTPVSHLIELAGGYKGHSNDARHLVMGGPMMGFSLANDTVPVVKATNNILVMLKETIPMNPGYHDECVRCGNCAEVCPAQLLPQQMYWYSRAKDYEKTEQYNLFDCIECGCCSAVCPSQIPLVQYYRAAKSEVRAQRQAQFKSDRARIRFEFREKRIALKKQQDEERKRAKREALKKKTEKTSAGADKSAVDPVQAALARVKAKKAAQEETPKNTTNLTTAQQKQIDEADARRSATREEGE